MNPSSRCRRGILISSVFIAAAAAAAPPAREASAGQIRGPMLGYVVEPDSLSLRPILGIPGASTLGPRVELPAALSRIEMSPAQAQGIVVSGEGREAGLLRLSDEGAKVLPIEGAAADPQRIVFSPRGESAVLFFEGSRKAQVVQGLSAQPRVEREFDLSTLPGAITTLATNDKGDVVLAATAAGESGGAVYVADRSGTPRFLVAAAATGISFLAGRSDAALADAEKDEVLLLEDLSGAFRVRRLAGPEAGISQPLGVQVTADNQSVVVANRGAATVTTLSLAGGTAASVACACQPTGLYRMAGNAVFRLNEPSREPMYLYDGDSQTPRIVFVPADPETAVDRSTGPIRTPVHGRSR